MSHSASSLSLPPTLSREFLLHHRCCPVERGGDGSILVAVAPDAVHTALDDIAVAYQALITTSSVTAEELERLIERLTTRFDRSIELARQSDSERGDADDLTTDVRDLANQPPVVRYVNLLVRDANDAGASDIHLEATRTGLAARVDGVLVPALEPPPELHHAIVSRVKLLAELDIAERRRPQDGCIHVVSNR